MNQFGSAKPGNPEVCAHCEALLMDVLDRTASAGDQAYFDQHIATCTSCSRMFVDAKRGGAWLEMLRDPRPEPSAALFERILAQTSGLQIAKVEEKAAGHLLTFPAAGEAGVVAATVPVAPIPYAARGAAGFPGAQVIPFRMRTRIEAFAHKMLQPRLAMTAAMAFFSIALTLNLTGVHLGDVSASDLKPANLRKSFFTANASVVRYYTNLRVVYELEARVHDMRASDSDTDGNAGAAPAAGQQQAPAGGPDGVKKQADPSGSGGQEQPADPNPPEKRPKGKTGPGTSFREPFMPETRFVASLVSETDRHLNLTSDFADADRLSARLAGMTEFTIHPKGDLA